MKKIILITTTLLIASCASSPEKLQRATAKSIGGITSGQVSVSNIKQGMSAVEWQAKTAKDSYHCEADDMVREENCIKDK